VCEAQCDRFQRCQMNLGETHEACVADCMSDAPSEAIFKPGVLSTWAACLSRLACGVSDDSCLMEVVVSQDPNWETEPRSQACMARHQECEGIGSGVSFSDDQCVAYFLCTAKVVAEVDACLGLACDQIAGCLDRTLQW